MRNISFRTHRLVALHGLAVYLVLLGCDDADVTPSPPESKIALPDAVASTEQSDRGNQTSQSIATDSVKVIKVRVIPFSNAKGWKSKAVLVKWKNVGKSPIRAVEVDILLLDRRGHTVEVIENQPIYAESDEWPGVAPGETYEDPADEGFLIDSFTAENIRRARVKVKQVFESGAF